MNKTSKEEPAITLYSSLLRLVQITECPRHLNQSNFILTLLTLFSHGSLLLLQSWSKMKE